MSRKFHINPQEKEVLLDKYLRGDCSSEETERIHAWLKELRNDDDRWRVKPAGEQQKYLADLYRNIESSIEDGEKRPRAKRIKVNLIRVAASLVLICGITLLFYRYKTNDTQYIVEKNATTGVKELHLPDGSLIWLNEGTTLRYPEAFGAESREVMLEGEAFFEVTEDKTRPFIIHSPGMRTRVLGTSFNVQAYKAGATARVVVVSGTVEVSLPEEAASRATVKESLILKANEMGTLSRSDKTLKGEKLRSTGRYTAWKDGKLIFRQTAMSEVVLRLEKALGLKIKLENPAIGRCRITGRFDKDQTAELTIAAICRSIEASYRISDGTVFIRGQGCSE